jgi:hypothetical protein
MPGAVGWKSPPHSHGLRSFFGSNTLSLNREDALNPLIHGQLTDSRQVGSDGVNDPSDVQQKTGV